MKTVQFSKAYINENGLATLEFIVEMKTRHDPKGRFSIGFLIIDRKDGQGVKLGIFDDDRKIIGTFDDKETAIQVLDKIIELRKSQHVFFYNYPDTKAWKKGPSVRKEMIMNFEQDSIDGFKLSKQILESGVITEQQKTSNWRME